MKAIDELIEKYLRLNFNNDTVDVNDVINDLETLKAELKEQHKKDVEVFDNARKSIRARWEQACGVALFDYELGALEAIEYIEQYYNQNH